MQFVTVIPISNKAKNRLANIMDKNKICMIEQRLDDKVFLTSSNGKYHFWVMIHNDSDWMIKP